MFLFWRCLNRQWSQQVWRQCHTSHPVPSNVQPRHQSVAAVIDNWTHQLETDNVPESRESVQLIVANVLGQKMIHGVSMDTILCKAQLARIEEMCRKRRKRMPVQYIIEEWDFHDLTLKMRSLVFIPRPETEELAQLAYNDILNKISEQAPGSTPTRILELGCGSGAISVYLLNKLHQTEVVAIDRSKEACELTKENAVNTGVHTRLTTLTMDYSQPDSLSTLKSHGLYNLIIANPPYVRTEEINSMEMELTRYEDPHAFDGGKDGLDYVRTILSMSTQLLKPKGSLWLEVGLGHCDMIKSEVKGQIPGLHFCSAIPDFTNRDRFCVLRT